MSRREAHKAALAQNPEIVFCPAPGEPLEALRTRTSFRDFSSGFLRDYPWMAKPPEAAPPDPEDWEDHDPELRALSDRQLADLARRMHALEEKEKEEPAQEVSAAPRPAQGAEIRAPGDPETPLHD